MLVSLWRDGDGDGEVDSGEVLTLGAVSLESINLTGTANNSTANIGDVVVVNNGSWTRTDGTTAQFADAALTFFPAAASHVTATPETIVNKLGWRQLAASGGVIKHQLHQASESLDRPVGMDGVAGTGFRRTAGHPQGADGILEAVRRNNLVGGKQGPDFWNRLVEHVQDEAGEFAIGRVAAAAQISDNPLLEPQAGDEAGVHRQLYRVDPLIDGSTIEQGRQLVMIAQDLASFGASHSASLELQRGYDVRPTDLFAA